MHPRQFARIFGVILVIIGATALIPSLSGSVPTDFPPLNLDSSYGLYLGLLPLNIINKVLMMGLGALGIFASMSPTIGLPMSIRWSQILCGISLLAAVLGLIESTCTLGGYMPLFGGTAVFHFIEAALAGYFGFALRAKAAKRVDLLVKGDKDHIDRKAS